MKKQLLQECVEKLLKESGENSESFYIETKERLYRGVNTFPLYNLEMAKNLGLNLEAALELTNNYYEKTNSYNWSSVIIELAGMIKNGILGEDCYEYLTDEFLGKKAGELAVTILETKGVYFKKASLSKDAEFKVTEGRYRFRLYPVIDSANSLSKNKTTKEVKTNNNMKPSKELELLMDLYVIRTSKSFRDVHAAILNRLKNKTDMEYVKYLRDIETREFNNYMSLGSTKAKDSSQFLKDMGQMFAIIFKYNQGSDRTILEKSYKYLVNKYKCESVVEFSTNPLDSLSSFTKAV